MYGFFIPHYTSIYNFQFKGVYQFKYPIQDLLHYVPSLEDMEILVTATVGDHLLDEVVEGFSTARVFNSSIRLKFLGDSPQVFKPGMPVTAYVSQAYITLFRKFCDDYFLGRSILPRRLTPEQTNFRKQHRRSISFRWYERGQQTWYSPSNPLPDGWQPRSMGV